jgi:hypothetical protein
MTNRELFNSVMHYGEFDRVPAIHWGGWNETRERWLAEGLPADVGEADYFGVSRMNSYVGFHVGLYPHIPDEIIEETADYKLYRNTEGVVLQEWKNKSSIPHFVDFTLKDAKAWPEFKKRLQPDLGRIPADLDARIERAKAVDAPIVIDTGSMIGWIRNWMGVENLAYLCYDDRDVLADMCNTISDLVCWQLDIILPRVKVDMGWGWEDICFRTGPLVSPDVFKECAVPGYRKISDKLLQYGCDLHLVDCDGLVDDLIPHWLDGGVNVMFPIEIGVWEADPAHYKKKYGKELRIYGGIDKMQIAKGPAAIRAEIERRLPLMKGGGFVPLPDHLIPPETSLEDYKYYLKQIEAIRF